MNVEAFFVSLFARSVLLRDFAVPHYIYVAITVPRSRMMTSWAILRSKGTEAGMQRRRRGVGQARRPRIVSKQEGYAGSRGRGFAICDLLLRPFNAVGSGRASEGLSPAVTWGVARGAAQTSMQGALVHLGRSHEGRSHEGRSPQRVGWAVREREN